MKKILNVYKRIIALGYIFTNGEITTIYGRTDNKFTNTNNYYSYKSKNNHIVFISDFTVEKIFKLFKGIFK